jgi:hypothetical protein
MRELLLMPIFLILVSIPVLAQDALQLEVVAIQSPQQKAGELLQPVRQRVGDPLKPIAVRVQDEKSRPVPNATVSWSIKANPAGATPASGSGVTGPNGEVVIRGLVANWKPGPYHVALTAEYMGKTSVAGTAVAVINMLRPRTKRNVFILGAAVAVGTALAVVLTRGSSPSATISTVTSTGPVGHP